ncbi:hypothetical protein ACA910_010600 [Epithemia clementina (nom. ined.)]
MLEMAKQDDEVDLLPIVMPTMVKMFTSLRLATDSLDTLEDGLQPFAWTLTDASSPGAEAATDAARQASEDYDQLMASSVSAGLCQGPAHHHHQSSASAASFQMKAMFQATRLVLMLAMGQGHPLYRSYHRFVQRFSKRETMYLQRLASLRIDQDISCLTRYNQLQLSIWFRNMRVHDSLPPLPPPGFEDVLNQLEMSQASWVPVVPAKYLTQAALLKSIGGSSTTTSGSTITTSSSAGSSNPASSGSATSSNRSAARAAQVINVQRNPIFKEFEEQLGKTKLNDAIKKAGTPPIVRRPDHEQGGAIVDVAMCGSFHLRGVCNSKCGCRADHAPHTEAEDKQLQEWCKVAFA